MSIRADAIVQLWRRGEIVTGPGVEVGQGYIDVEPRLDRAQFNKELLRLQRDRTTIKFKADLDTKAILARRAEMRAIGDTIGREFSGSMERRILAQRAEMRRIGDTLAREFTIPMQKRIANNLQTISRQVRENRDLEQGYAAAGDKAAKAFTREMDDEFKQAVRRGIGIPDVDTNTLRTRLRRVEREFGDSGDRSGSLFAHHLGRGLEGLASILPARLETVFTRTGPVVGSVFAVAFVAGLASTLPTLIAGLMGGLVTTIGLGVMAGGIALVADDPRVKRAGQRLMDTLVGGGPTGGKAVAAAQKKVDAARKRISDIQMFGATTTAGSMRALAKARHDEALALNELAIAQKKAGPARKSPIKEAARQAFVGPTVQSLDTINKSLLKNMPHITNMLQAAAKFIPIITKGVTSFLDNLLPGLDRLVSSQFMIDLMQTLAAGMGHIGAALSDFFTRLLDDPAAMRGVTAGFEDLLNAIASGIRLAGDFIRTMAHLHNWLDDIFFPGLRKVWKSFRENVVEFFGPSLLRIVIANWFAIGHALEIAWTDTASFFRQTWTSIASWFRNTWTNEIAETARNGWTNVANFFRTSWTTIANFFRTNWNNITDTASRALRSLSLNVGRVLNTIRGAWVSAWNAMKTFLGGVWNGITGAVQRGWNGVIGVLNRGISGINSVLGTLGIKQRISLIGLAGVGTPAGDRTGAARRESFATGGRVRGPGGPTSDQIPAMLSNGEYVVNAAATRANLGLLQAINDNGVKTFAAGGIVGDISLMLSPWANILKRLVQPAINKLGGGMPNNALGWLGHGAGTFLGKQIVPWIKGMFDKVVKTFTATFVRGAGSGGAGRWAGTVMQALSILHLPASWLGPTLTLIARESGGNPNAINLWDINARRGDPSRGLMQTIGSTFAAHRLPGLSSNIYDPLSNIVAGLRYILSRYGTIFRVQQAVGATPRGYDSGGYLPPGVSLVRNNTGKPELVLTHDQQMAMLAGGDHYVSVYVGNELLVEKIQAVVDDNNANVTRAFKRGRGVGG